LLRMLDLFSGIGGISLAAEWTEEIETVAFCEIADYPQKVLKKHWPDVPIISDIHNVTKEKLVEMGVIKNEESECKSTGVDIICGGFP
jgi:DNA (cytosine-5)-methyltransferase 1